MIKKIISYFSLLLCFFILYTYQKTTTKETLTKSSSITTSSQTSQSYIAISLAELQEKMTTAEDFFLYVGRPTCPYCESFLPKLEEAIQESSTIVYYLDTDSESDVSALTNFLTDQEVETVPHLAYYQSNKKAAHLEKGSEASIEEIIEFLQQNKK
ncbi:TPA: thioredoxin [Streptococcus suis]